MFCEIGELRRFVMTFRHDSGFYGDRNHCKTIDFVEDGARYRVRTCDPYRVKVVLYH